METRKIRLKKAKLKLEKLRKKKSISACDAYAKTYLICDIMNSYTSRIKDDRARLLNSPAGAKHREQKLIMRKVCVNILTALKEILEEELIDENYKMIRKAINERRLTRALNRDALQDMQDLLVKIMYAAGEEALAVQIIEDTLNETVNGMYGDHEERRKNAAIANGIIQAQDEYNDTIEDLKKIGSNVGKDISKTNGKTNLN